MMKIHYLKNTFPHNKKVEKYNKKIKKLQKLQKKNNVSIGDVDVIVVGGGDGTLLKAIKQYRHLNKIFWGFNAGNVGFLMNNGFPHEYEERRQKVKSFSLIKATVHYTVDVPDGKTANLYTKSVPVTETVQAFNDIFIAELNGWIDFKCEDEDNILGNFKGSGLLISTSAGSTGMNKNNKGVILPLSSNNWVITGDKTNKRVNYVLEPNKIEVKCQSRGSITLFVDGNNQVIENVHKIVIEQGDKVKVMFGDYKKFKTRRN